jgi:hypothetical protein
MYQSLVACNFSNQVGISHFFQDQTNVCTVILNLKRMKIINVQVAWVHTLQHLS